MQNHCQYQYQDLKTGRSEERICQHPLYDDEHCIFHSLNIEQKRDLFPQHLEDWLQECHMNAALDWYDFQGFIFPEVTFQQRSFLKKVDFRSSQFTEEANFSSCKFLGGGDFRWSKFFDQADFEACQFHDKSTFHFGQFSAEANFKDTLFETDVDFCSCKFLEEIDFRKVQWKGNANFDSCEFSENVDFHENQFLGCANFSLVQFSGVVDLSETRFGKDFLFRESHCYDEADFHKNQFQGKVDFYHSQFSEEANFHSCEFLQESNFHRVQFSNTVDFHSSKFSGDVHFHGSQFLGLANFRCAYFAQRLDFVEAKFLDEVDMRESTFAFLKNLNAKGANFDHAILENTNYWKMPKLENYSFRNAFLLNISLNNKEVFNCDFTGATLDYVPTRGWKVDYATLKNTKYIYTNYRVESFLEEGEERYRYFPKEDSRIPGGGFFGEGENQEFTLADYLKEPYKWSYALAIPAEMRTAVMSYIQFFNDFMQYTENMEVELRTRNEGGKLRVEFLIEDEEDQDFVQEKFREHLNNRTQSLNQLKVQLKNKSVSDDGDQELFILRYENQINNLKNEIQLIQYTLEHEREHKKELIEQEKKHNEQLLQFIQQWMPAQNTLSSNASSALPLSQNLSGPIQSTVLKEGPPSRNKTLDQLVNVKSEILCIFKGYQANYCSVYTTDNVSLENNLFKLTLRMILECLNEEEDHLLQINQSILVNPNHAIFSQKERQWVVSFPSFPHIGQKIREDIEKKEITISRTYLEKTKEKYSAQFRK